MCEGLALVVPHDQGLSFWCELAWTSRACPYDRTWKMKFSSFSHMGTVPNGIYVLILSSLTIFSVSSQGAWTKIVLQESKLPD